MYQVYPFLCWKKTYDQWTIRSIRTNLTGNCPLQQLAFSMAAIVQCIYIVVIKSDFLPIIHLLVLHKYLTFMIYCNKNPPKVKYP